MASHIMRPVITLAPETRQTYRIFYKGSLAAQACRAIPSACVHQLSQRPPSQRRSYAAPAKKYKAPAKKYKAPGKNYTASAKTPWVPKGPVLDTAMPKNIPERLLAFSSADIPPMTVWESLLGLAPKGLTLADLDRTARKYCAVAAKNMSTWKGGLETQHGVDLYTLHYTATLLLAGPVGPFWHLGAHMLRTASDLNYDPSTLSLLRLVLRTTSGGPESIKYKNALHGPLIKFRLLIPEGRNPDVLTIDGALRIRRGDARGALESFNRAIKAAAAPGGRVFAPAPTQEELKHRSAAPPPPVRKPAWALESMCHLERGHLLFQQGNRAAAEAAFRVAAVELDTAAGYLELGKMLPVGSSERESCLLKAILTGKTDAIPLLSVFSKDKTSDPARDPEEDQRWADEWRLLARGVEEEGKVNGSLGLAS